MFMRQLKAIGYPQADTFSVDDENDFRRLVGWLENQKLGFLPKSMNANAESMTTVLMNAGDDKNWNDVFASYLTEVVQCPFESTDHSSVAGFLLQLAIRAGFERNSSDYQSLARDVDTGSGNVFDKISLSQMKVGIEALAQLLDIPHHYDEKVMLRAIAYLLKERLSEKNLKDIHASDEVKESCDKIEFELQEISPGMDLKDEQISVAVRVLRLLHIRNLRQLQTMVDEVIVLAQTITSNPKTDQRLGQVGR